MRRLQQRHRQGQQGGHGSLLSLEDPSDSNQEESDEDVARSTLQVGEGGGGSFSCRLYTDTEGVENEINANAGIEHADLHQGTNLQGTNFQGTDLHEKK